MKRVCSFAVSHVSYALLLRTYMPPIRPLLPTEYRGISVCMSACQSVTPVSPAKTAELIEVPFGLWAGMGPKHHVLHGSPDPPFEGAIVVDRGAHCKL